MKGILFSPDMQLAIREGRKTQTRRLASLKEINKEPDRWRPQLMNDGTWFFENPDGGGILIKPRYHIGETVYIKEAWATEKQYDTLAPCDIPRTAKIFYVIDGVGEWPINLTIGKLRSPMFLMEWLTRYFIQITDERPERLQVISRKDVDAEGTRVWFDNHPDVQDDCPLSAQQVYSRLWDSINKKSLWSMNPWVFVYSFKYLPAHTEVK